MITPSFSTNALLKAPRLLFNCTEILVAICNAGKFHPSLYIQTLNSLSLLFANIPFHDKFVQVFLKRFCSHNFRIII